MNGFPQLLVCLLVAVASGIPVRDQDDCLKVTESEHHECKDYDASISCIEKELNDPQLDLTDDKRMELTQELNYIKGLKKQEDLCPALKEKGSCIDREINICLGEASTFATEECKQEPNILGCFVKLNKTCSTHSVRYEINTSMEVIESCKSGDLKEEMEMERCSYEIDGCAEEFDKLYHSRLLEPPRPMVETALKCLGNITVCSDDDPELLQRRKELTDILQAYDKGFLSGKCSQLAASKCQIIFWYGSDQVPDSQKNYRHCDKSYIKKAKECLDTMKPHCKSVEMENKIDDLAKGFDAECRDQ